MNFSVYRCPDPIKTDTTTPWYPIQNICPCDPSLSNPTGRGFTPCTYGVQFEKPNNFANASQQQLPTPNLQGSLWENNQFVPPQLEPRPLTRIGQSWRSGN